MTRREALGGGPGWRQVLAPAAALGLGSAVLVALVVVARNTGGGSPPPEPGAMVMPVGAAYAAFTVERVEGANLAVSGSDGARLVAIPPATPVWLLEPATLGDALAGLPVAVIGVPNEVRNATLRAVVIGVGGAAPGFVAGPFAGHEVWGEANALPLVSGTVSRVEEGGRLVILTAAGEAEVWMGAGAPLLVAREGSFDEVQPGDRVAVRLGADGGLDPSRGILVWPGD